MSVYSCTSTRYYTGTTDEDAVATSDCTQECEEDVFNKDNIFMCRISSGSILHLKIFQVTMVHSKQLNV